jgi:hypothetical protein
MGALTFNEFMGHSNRGGKRNFLKGWKDKDPYSITIWLHTQASILALWRHRFVRVVRREVEGKPKVEVWSNPLVCWEDEELLQEQNFYDRDTGDRQTPPQLCGHCRLLEWVREEVRSKRLDWRTPLFRFPCDDARKEVWLHAGGLVKTSKNSPVDSFSDKLLSAEKKKQMVEIPREQGGPVYMKNAFRQDSTAKLEYAFAVVDSNEVGKGVQVAVEGNLVGQKTQEVITHAMKSLGPERGNIQRFPYAIMWEHNPAEGIPFDKMYSAIRMEQVRLTPAIKKLIVDDPAPDFSSLAARFNPREHRANLERYALHAIPFDKLFAPSIAMWDAQAKQWVGEQAAAGTRVPEVGRPPPPPAAEDPDEEVVCGDNGCQQVMRMRDPKCPACGKVYVIEADPLPLPPPMRTRAQVATPAASYDPTPAVDDEDAIPF